MPYRSYPDRLLARFWAMVRKTDGCWIWTGAKSRHGYGKVKRDGRFWGAHRYAYALEHGTPPSSMDVCHRCDNPLCVRPDHLFLGTRKDNMRDAVQKGRTAKGEGHGRGRMTVRQVLDMRLLRRAGYTTYEIAREFGISQQHASSITRGFTWKHIGAEEAAA